MPFFGNQTVIDIAESHIRQIRDLEEAEAARLLARYRQIRFSLRDRLDTLPPGRFTAQHLRGVLVQVETAISAMESSLLTGMELGAENISLEGVEHIVEEIETFEEEFTGAVVPISLDAAIIASENNNFLLNRYDASIKAYSADIRSILVSGLSQATIEEVTVGQVLQRLGRFFIGEEWKLQRLARTEFHHVYNAAKLRSMTRIHERFIPDLKKTLFHAMDERTAEDSKQLAQKNPIIPISEPFKFVYLHTLKSGEVREDVRIFMNPPDRPNDRSILLPYREEWTE